MNRAWEYEIGETDTVIAILDSGINLMHPDLECKIYRQWDTWEQHDRPLDRYNKYGDWGHGGHGTACAGIAAATTNRDTAHGTESGAGVDWNARIMPLKVGRINVCYPPYSPPYINWWDTDEEHVMRGLWRALHCGADIISMSFLHKGSAWDGVEDYCDIAYYTGTRGILLFAGAGNDNEGTIYKPARFGTVICVGAVDYNGVRVKPENGYNWGSHYGPEMELAAPGVGMLTTNTPLPNENFPWPHKEIPYYGWSDDDMFERYDPYFGGTSGATPLVAGCAGLFWAAYPKHNNSQIRGIMAKTARDKGSPGRDDEYGWGIVDPLRGILMASTIDNNTKGNVHGASTSATPYCLKQNAPNPVSSFTLIEFALPVSESASLRVYDVKGRCVSILVDGELPAGEHSVSLDGSSLANGVYIYSILTPNYTATKKLVISR